jgi:probable F420-dependent oxidoreductase
MTKSLGQFGVWRSERFITIEEAQAADRLGFGALWLGGPRDGELSYIEQLLDATSDIVIATGVLNVWITQPEQLAASYHRIAARHPERFLLGIGAGHPEAHGDKARQPLAEVVRFLDVFDSEGVPVADRALAALGPRMLQLAVDRTAAAHPYLTTPEHTREARALVGPSGVLAPEQKVVIGKDAETARGLGRQTVPNPYFGLRNYVSNLRQLGYEDADFADGGSDRIIDALAVHGTDEEVGAGIRAHLDAGADHVAVQVLTTPDDDVSELYARLAGLLGVA